MPRAPTIGTRSRFRMITSRTIRSWECGQTPITFPSIALTHRAPFSMVHSPAPWIETRCWLGPRPQPSAFKMGPAWIACCPRISTARGLLPQAAPDYFVHFISNALDLYQFHVDFTTPGNSTFRGRPRYRSTCSAKPAAEGPAFRRRGRISGSTRSADRLMYRLAYRNFGDHESLVVNHSITAGSSVGVRWYELRQRSGRRFWCLPAGDVCA